MNLNLFPRLKEKLRGRKFKEDSEVMEEFVEDQDEDFFLKVF